MNAQTAEALKLANDIRIEAVRQRNALVGRPVREIVEAIVHPTDELASMKLKQLFARKGREQVSLIPKFGPAKLRKALERMPERRQHGRQVWHEDMRLRELSEMERRLLVRTLVEVAPANWKKAAA